MVIEHAPAPVQLRGVTQLMAVGETPAEMFQRLQAPILAEKRAVAIGAGLGLLAAILLKSKRKFLFTAAGAALAGSLAAKGKWPL